MLPSASHAFGKRPLPFEIRTALCSLALRSLSSDLQQRVAVSTIEAVMLAEQPQRPVFSIDVLERLRRDHPSTSFTLAIGPDNAAPDVFSRFHRHQDISRLFGVMVSEEHGDGRSTLCRELLGSWWRTKNDDIFRRLERLLPEPVLKSVIDNRLYGAPL